MKVGDTVRMEHKPVGPYEFARPPWSGLLTVEHVLENGELWVTETVASQKPGGKPRRYGIWAQAAPENCAGEGRPMHVVPAII